MTINATKGTFSGSFIHPVTHFSTKIQGVLFEKQNIAGGYFVNHTQSGAVSLSGD